jgi:N-acyl-D-aspartate/D-glutamate deacylase
VLGEVDRRPTPEELKEMQSHVRAAMEDGAIGLSTALIYPPATYGTTEEIAALAGVVGEYGGRYYTHMRNEGDRLTEAVDEALEIGQTGNVPVHIFHLKSAGRQNWGKIDQAIARIKAARAEGRQVTADIYPYVNNGLGIEAFVHPRHFTDGHGAFLQKLDNADLRAQMRREMETEGGWENWYRHVGQNWDKVVLGTISAEAYREHAGQSLGEIARQGPVGRVLRDRPPRRVRDAREHVRSEQDQTHAAGVRFLLHRRWPGGRIEHRLTSAGVRILSADSLALCARAGRRLTGTRHCAGDGRGRERRYGL